MWCSSPILTNSFRCRGLRKDTKAPLQVAADTHPAEVSRAAFASVFSNKQDSERRASSGEGQGGCSLETCEPGEAGSTGGRWLVTSWGTLLGRWRGRKCWGRGSLGWGGLSPPSTSCGEASRDSFPSAAELAESPGVWGWDRAGERSLRGSAGWDSERRLSRPAGGRGARGAGPAQKRVQFGERVRLGGAGRARGAGPVRGAGRACVGRAALRGGWEAGALGAVPPRRGL